MKLTAMLLLAFALSGCATELPRIGEPIADVRERWSLNPDDVVFRRNWQRYTIYSPWHDISLYVTTINDTVSRIEKRRTW